MQSQAITEFGKPLQLIETPTPTPAGTEILLKVHNAGVCHSDVHIHDGYFDLGGGNKLPMANMKLPHTLGHEIEGEVVAIGPDVKGVSVGQRYAAFPWIGCGKCPACERGEENICVGGPRQLGCSSGVAGGYATHVMVPHAKYLIDYGKTNPALGAAYMCSGLTAFSAMKKIGKLGANDVPAAPLNTLDEVFNDPQVREYGFPVEAEHPVMGKMRLVGSGVELDRTPPAVTLPPPMLGEHTDEILENLGYEKAMIEKLREQGVI